MQIKDYFFMDPSIPTIIRFKEQNLYFNRTIRINLVGFKLFKSRKIITSNSLNLFTHAFFKIKAQVSLCPKIIVSEQNRVLCNEFVCFY